MNKSVPIPKSTIIELRQKNNNTLVVNDGEFNVNLNEQNIILEEGDTIQLKSVYLDTGSVETGFIDLTPDNPQPAGADPKEPVTTISIDIGKYVMNVPSSQEGEFYTTDTASKPIVNSKVRCPQFATQVEQVNGFSDRIRANTDGKPYVMCLATESGADTMFEITGFVIQTDDPVKGRDPIPDPSSFLKAKAHFQMTYYLANLPVSPQSLRTADFFFDPTQLSTQKKTELLSRFNQNQLTINQGILDDFREAWGNSDNLGQYSSVPDFVQPVANPPVASQNAPQIKRIISDEFPNPSYLLYLFQPATVGVAPNTQHLSPIIETISFRLPSTRYTSSELAKRITQEASKIATGGVIGSKEYVSTDNPLYRSINDEIKRQNPLFEPSADDATAVGLMANGKVVFVEVNSDADERETFRFNSFKTTDRNYMIGSAGGFSLEYDEESDKFSIQNIHSPLRDQNPLSSSLGAPQVRGYAQPFMRGNGTANAPPLNVKFYVNKYSGIFIAGLSPPDLWKRQMKFDLTSLVPNITSSGVRKKIGKAPVGGADNREEYLIDCDNCFLTDGQHITGTFESVGTAEQHSVSTTDDPATGGGAGGGPNNNALRITANSSTFDTIINFLPATEAQQSDPTENAQPVPYIATNTDQVINIFSQGQIDDGEHAVADEGYYKVVVDSKISNELVGANQTIRNVSAIISKYNSYGNFTSAYGEGSVSYTHQGQPLVLTDFRVKILTPDGSLATDLNDRNTIFLELIKNV